MSDGITITPGTGRTIHADVVTLNGTTGLAQVIKIIDATDASTNRLSISSSGAAKVDGSAVTQPVSGTVSAAKSGTWSVTVSNSSIPVTKSGTWGMTVSGSVSAAKSGTWSMTVSNSSIPVTKSGTWGMTVSGTVSAAKSGTWGMTVSGTVSAAKSGTWGMTVSGTVSASKSGTWGMTVSQSTASNLNVTEASAASSLTSLQLIDDVVYTDDTSTHSTGTSKGALLMAAATPTDANVDANDIGALAMTLSRRLHVSVQDAAAKKMTFAASTTPTVTNLHSVGSSATWVAGWESGAIDNSSNLYIDYAINLKITVAAASLTAGEIRMYLVAEADDSTWPDVFDGTESTETVTDTEMRDAICKLAAISQTDTTNSDVYWLACPSAATVFGGCIPRKFVVFVTHSTGQNLAASGNVLYVRGAYLT